MTEPLRITPAEVFRKVKTGETLLVCAYDDDAKFRQLRLEGAISLAEFRSLLPGLSKEREIVFYCAWPQEASAAGQAALMLQQGYRNAKALKGGVEGWKQAGYMLVPE